MTELADPAADGLAGARHTCRRLRDLAQTIETRFVTVGDRLYAAIGTIRGLASTLEGLSGELGRAELQEGAGRLREVASEVGGMSQALGEEQAMLARLYALNGEVGRRIARLRQTVGVISILGVNARMTASSINAGSEDLAAFSEEIVRVAKSAVATVEGYRREHEKLLATIAGAVEAQAAFAREHRETFREVAERLGASVEAVDRRRVAAKQSTADLSGNWARVSERVGAVVRALQIGDMTRQRVEHVCDTLDALVVDGRTPVCWAEGLSAQERDTLVGHVARLQAAQVGHAAEEFGTELASIARSLETLGRDTDEIVRLGGDLYGGTGRSHSFLQDLEARLAAARSLLVDCRRARAELDGVVVALAGTVRDLRARLRSVEEIQSDMLLVGLNTTLRCGRLGAEGKPLAVIAQELRQYATQTVEDARGLTAALEVVDEAAHAFEGASGGRSGTRLDALEQGMAAALETFRATGEKLGEALAGLERDGDDVRTTLLEAMDDAGLAELSGVLDDAHAALGALGSEAAAGLPEALNGVFRRIVGERYTMDSERIVHEHLTGSAAHASRLTSVTTTDDFLDDVLF